VELIEAEDLDAIWVTLSNRATPSVVQSAADHGVHVFAEKSLARTGDALEPVVESVRDVGITVGVAYINRGDPVYRELRDRCAAGFFGELRAFEAQLIKNKLAARLRSDRQSDFLYAREDARGGILQWLGCHYLDLFEWVLDDPIVRVSAQLSYGVDAVDTETGALVQRETESGAHGCLQLGYYLRDGPERSGDTCVGPAYEPFQIYGTERLSSVPTARPSVSVPTPTTGRTP